MRSLCRLVATCLSTIFLTALLAEPAAAQYHEQLVLRPLPLSALLASFNFRANTTVADFEAHNYRFFPRSVAQILQHAGTRELHLRFALGRWDAESWGTRPWDGTREGGTGVELWAWLEAQTDEEADQKWLTLTNALSGLFCASLNFIDGTRTTRPAMSFTPEGDHPNVAAANMHLLHGTLPREVVCTENLTPFLKLLPCKGKAGIASLLDGHKLFDASWQSMAIDIRPVCPEGGECVLEIEQTIDMVLDIDRSKRPRDNPIPRPPPAHELKCDTSKDYHSDDTCFPADSNAHQDWTLSQIFGRPMKGTCPLADPDSRPVCIDVPGSRTVYVSGGIYEFKTTHSRCFTVEPHAEFNIILPQPEEQQQVSEPGAGSIVEPEVPALYAERSLTGHGAERGGVQTIFTNPSPDEEVEFVYMETLPWFMRIYLHTLQARIASSGPGSSPDGKIIQEIYYRPARDRARGTQLEVRLRVPPASTMFLTYDFEKSILRYTEYPPDANRGFDVAAAVITILRGGRHTTTSAITTGSTKRRANLRTASLLLSLPTPDFSMPYNVIIFTSTCIALAFGGMFNLLVRRFVAADEGPELGLGSAATKIKERLRAKFGKGAASSSDDAQLIDEKSAPELEPEREDDDSTWFAKVHIEQ
ncbi:GPI transamidase component GPI16 [Magnaporthiopsis poae ATCC 64411]|uniref:GPI transamidase component GPI16 n=1 Tax=Magnaporthiopsis poae (strain ATCC 64411 / 73-15) TaxID=644358 RepID=A0A0C4DYE7_MAGP6|nr:GPI transamidase component GPI16 [Magnaporthiopsis poae ATCC 64411]